MGLPGTVVDTMTVEQLFWQFEGFKQMNGGGEATSPFDRDRFMQVLAEETAAGRVLN